MGEKGIVTGIEQANVLAVAISITGFYFHFLAGSRLRSEPRRKIETKRRCEVVCEKNGEFMRRQESKEAEKLVAGSPGYADDREAPSAEYPRNFQRESWHNAIERFLLLTQETREASAGKLKTCNWK